MKARARELQKLNKFSLFPGMFLSAPFWLGAVTGFLGRYLGKVWPLLRAELAAYPCGRACLGHCGGGAAAPGAAGSAQEVGAGPGAGGHHQGLGHQQAALVGAPRPQWADGGPRV